MIFNNDFFYLLPEIFLGVFILLFVFFGVVYAGEEKIFLNKRKTPLLHKAFFASFISIIFFTFVLVSLIPANYVILNGSIVSTETTKIAKLLILLLSVALHFYF